MFSKKLGSQKGFTIIEVLIVLAIAGLILLVVFLAVPALQRNSRNTSYRSEASNILGAYTEISNNNNGKILTASISTTVDSDADKVLKAANAKNITTLKIQAHSTNLIDDVASSATPTTYQVNTATAIIRTGAKCATDTTSGTPTAGSARQIAIYFVVETSSGQELQCQGS